MNEQSDIFVLIGYNIFIGKKLSDRKQLCPVDPIDGSDRLTDHAHARQDQARAETSKREALVLYDALPACTNCKILSNGK